ncbi:MAG: hypothetical protein WBX25_06610 [Rhodomicrobium sp.]
MASDESMIRRSAMGERSGSQDRSRCSRAWCIGISPLPYPPREHDQVTVELDAVFGQAISCHRLAHMPHEMFPLLLRTAFLLELILAAVSTRC